MKDFKSMLRIDANNKRAKVSCNSQTNISELGLQGISNARQVIVLLFLANLNVMYVFNISAIVGRNRNFKKVSEN